ncbi:hypothetical protein QJS10_CPB14g00977 [Acorus calamus]|uniref:Uncharacterized protein n=1 Tax=Acorus calamus TaxID=4465 RepID=A0AAV9DAB8_ACOCL|nr:hypothetical protein QJS10_CPB14g00977 [Acorus calamus]
MDPLATDYGTIDELCDLCVGYGAMGILEDIISARVSMTASQDSTVSQYTASALARICLYCETHRLFNFLYRFQALSANQRTFHGQSVAINVSTIERNTESPTRGVNTKPRSRNTRTTCQNFSNGPLLKTANAPPISRTLWLTTTTSNPQTTATNNTDLGYNASFHAGYLHTLTGGSFGRALVKNTPSSRRLRMSTHRGRAAKCTPRDSYGGARGGDEERGRRCRRWVGEDPWSEEEEERRAHLGSAETMKSREREACNADKGVR